MGQCCSGGNRRANDENIAYVINMSSSNDLAGFKKQICNNKDHHCTVSEMFNKFKMNLKECEHVKNSKTKKHESFWSKLVDKFDEIGDEIEDGIEYEAKQILSLISKFESEEQETYDDIDKELSEFFTKASNKILVEILEVFMGVLVDMQDCQIEFADFYDTLRETSIFHFLLPPLPKGWKDTLPPNHGFYNWSFTVKTDPEQVKTIKSVQDIRDLIAKAQEDPDDIKKVRVSAFRHSFSPLFSDDKQLHGLLLPHSMTTTNITTPDLKYDDELTTAVVSDLPETTGIQLLENNIIRVKAGSAINTYTTLAGKRADTKKMLFPSEKANVLQYFQGTFVYADCLYRCNYNSDHSFSNWIGHGIYYCIYSAFQTYLCSISLLLTFRHQAWCGWV